MNRRATYMTHALLLLSAAACNGPSEGTITGIGQLADAAVEVSSAGDVGNDGPDSDADAVLPVPQQEGWHCLNAGCKDDDYCNRFTGLCHSRCEANSDCSGEHTCVDDEDDGGSYCGCEEPLFDCFDGCCAPIGDTLGDGLGSIPIGTDMLDITSFNVVHHLTLEGPNFAWSHHTLEGVTPAEYFFPHGIEATGLEVKELTVAHSSTPIGYGIIEDDADGRWILHRSPWQQWQAIESPSGNYAVDQGVDKNETLHVVWPNEEGTLEHAVETPYQSWDINTLDIPARDFALLTSNIEFGLLTVSDTTLTYWVWTDNEAFVERASTAIEAPPTVFEPPDSWRLGITTDGVPHALRQDAETDDLFVRRPEDGVWGAEEPIAKVYRDHLEIYDIRTAPSGKEHMLMGRRTSDVWQYMFKSPGDVWRLTSYNLPQLRNPQLYLDGEVPVVVGVLQGTLARFRLE